MDAGRRNSVRVQTFLRFSIAGGLGFGIDATVFFALVGWTGTSWWLARVLAFLVAVGATWYLNRRLTFRSRGQAPREMLHYFFVQSAGCLINYLVFIAAVTTMPDERWPILPYLFGSAAALVWNYTLSRRFVFHPEQA